MEPFVGSQQFIQRLLARQRQVLPMRKQRVLLPLDVGPVLALQPAVFALPHFVEGLTQVCHDMELVEQNARLRCVPGRRVPKCLPHIHHRHTDAAALLRPQFSIEQVHTSFLPVCPAEPDCAPPQ